MNMGVHFSSFYNMGVLFSSFYNTGVKRIPNRLVLYILCKFGCTKLRNVAINTYHAHMIDYTLRCIITMTSLYTLTHHVVTIVVLNVYVCNLIEWLLRVITPVLQKGEKSQIYQEIRGCYQGKLILQF